MDIQSASYYSNAVIAIGAICALAGLAAYASAYVDVAENLRFPPVFSRLGLVVAIAALGLSWHEISEYHHAGNMAVAELRVDQAENDLIHAYLQYGIPGAVSAEAAEKNYRDQVASAVEIIRE